ncbi:MAG: Hpt domain-containing protein [Acidobacteriota bacterium]
MQRLTEATRTSLAEGIGLLVRAGDAGDANGVAHWAHSLKGNLLNAGLRDLAAVATDMEQQALSGVIPLLRGRLQAAEVELEEFLAGPGVRD